MAEEEQVPLTDTAHFPENQLPVVAAAAVSLLKQNLPNPNMDLAIMIVTVIL
jgi:hypothetical protein